MSLSITCLNECENYLGVGGDKIIWGWSEGGETYARTNTYTIFSLRMFGDLNFDDIIDSIDYAAASSLTEHGWALPVASNTLRKVELKTDLLIPGHLILSLTGDAQLRIWTTTTPSDNDTPLLVTGQTITNGVDGASFGAYPVSTLYVEAISSGIGTLTYSYVGTGSAEGFGYQAGLDITAVKVESIDISSTRLAESPNPPPFVGELEHVFRPDQSPVTDQHAAIFYKDVVDANFNVEDFDVTFTAALVPMNMMADQSTFVWEKVSGPDSGELLPSSSLTAIFRNPKKGGVYRFRLIVRCSGVDIAFGEANLVLPYAGAEMDSVMRSNLPMADAFVARIKTKHSPRQCRRLENLYKWFIDWNSGDYVGRPDNQASPAVWYYGQVSTALNENYRLGVVCTWKGRPVRMTKLSNFLVAYTIQYYANQFDTVG